MVIISITLGLDAGIARTKESKRDKFRAAYSYEAKCSGDGHPFTEKGKIGVRYDETLILEHD
jgi:hypothetical protein